MRLYDKIISLVGTIDDREQFGAITEMAKDLALAECFEISDDVFEACYNLSHSKPSSILSAVSMARIPYEKIWIEWVGQSLDGMSQEGLGEKPKPMRVGCLLKANSDLRSGIASWAWFHDMPRSERGGLVICPLALRFDWYGEETQKLKDFVVRLDDGTIDKLESSFNQYFPGLGFSWYEHKKDFISATQVGVGGNNDREAIAARLKGRWMKFAKVEEEIDAIQKLDSQFSVVANLHTFEMLLKLKTSVPPHVYDNAYKSWCEDLTGELPFIETFIIMLNSKNIIDRTGEENSKINKKRKILKRAPLREFTVTRLSMSRVIRNRLASEGMDKAKSRQHLVMGHFKIRKSGVYWWSPFIRNRSNPEIALRDHYEVNH